jgi:hypothetical protein
VAEKPKLVLEVGQSLADKIIPTIIYEVDSDDKELQSYLGNIFNLIIYIVFTLDIKLFCLVEFLG